MCLTRNDSFNCPHQVCQTMSQRSYCLVIAVVVSRSYSGLYVPDPKGKGREGWYIALSNNSTIQPTRINKANESTNRNKQAIGKSTWTNQNKQTNKQLNKQIIEKERMKEYCGWLQLLWWAGEVDGGGQQRHVQARDAASHGPPSRRFCHCLGPQPWKVRCYCSDLSHAHDLNFHALPFLGVHHEIDHLLLGCLM